MAQQGSINLKRSKSLTAKQLDAAPVGFKVLKLGLSTDRTPLRCMVYEKQRDGSWLNNNLVFISMTGSYSDMGKFKPSHPHTYTQTAPGEHQYSSTSWHETIKHRMVVAWNPATMWTPNNG